MFFLESGELSKIINGKLTRYIMIPWIIADEFITHLSCFILAILPFGDNLEKDRSVFDDFLLEDGGELKNFTSDNSFGWCKAYT
jgi:hypothetical protein